MSQSNAQQSSFDAHAHWAPRAYIDYAAQQGGTVSGGPISPLMHDLEARMKWMDARGVKTHVLTLSGSMPWQPNSNSRSAITSVVFITTRSPTIPKRCIS